MLSREQIETIKALVQKALSYRHILKFQGGQRRAWDESRVNRAPAGSSQGGQFTRQGGGVRGPSPDEILQRAQGAYEEGGTRAARERQREGQTAVPPGMERGTHDGQRVYDYQQRQEKLQAKGKGFANRPHGEGLPEPISESASANAKTLDNLTTGDPTDSRPLGGGSNASVIVTLDNGTEAVYKPERGEAWTGSFTNRDINRFITNRDFSLAEREAFASEVDQALGLDVVPLTVLRKTVDETHVDVNTTDEDGGGGGGYDEDYAREEYEKYKEKMIDDDSIMDEVGQRFEAKFEEAKNDHVSDLESRREEIQEMWDDLKKDYPEQTAYGSGSMMRQHPTLPMGSQAFERRERREPGSDVIDPIELFDDVGADVSAKFNREERDNIRAALKKRLDEGYRDLGEIDEEQAKEHLDRDDWYQEHEDTEANIRDEVYGEKVQSFTAWRHSQGYRSEDDYGGGSGDDRNTEAPHPSGGSFQHFREAEHYGDVTPEQGAKLAVLDYVIGSMDRHGRNLMFDDDGMVAIDNGYSMPDLPDSKQPDKFTFRTEGVGEWMNQGGTIPSDTRKSLQDAMEKTDWQALVDRHPNMTANERKAFLGRVAKAKTALQTTEGLRELWESLTVF